MKKVENIAGVTSVTKNPDYETLRQYWSKGGEQPSEEFAKKALMQLAENYKMENVTIKPDVIDAMFRQVQTDTTIAYKTHVIPGIIYVSEYDLGTNGHAYSDDDFINYRVDTGIQGDWNKGGVMRNDGVDIQVCHDEKTNGYEVFDIKDNEWLMFNVNTVQSGGYKVVIRYSNENAKGQLHLELQNGERSETVILPSTGSNAVYKQVVLSSIQLSKGTNKIKVVFDTGGFNLNYLNFNKNSN